MDSLDPQLEKLLNFAANITAEASLALRNRRAFPETESEIAIHMAYCDALNHAAHFEPATLQQTVESLGYSICSTLESTCLAEETGETSGEELLMRYYKDEQELCVLHTKRPELAETIAIWMAYNDSYQFAVCFFRKAVFEDDYRNLRKAVEGALHNRKIFDTWTAQSAIRRSDFDPPPPNPRLMRFTRPSGSDLHA